MFARSLRIERLRAPLLCVAFGLGYVAAQPLLGGSTQPLSDPVVVEGGRAKLERSFDVMCRQHADSVLRVVASAEAGSDRISHAVAVDPNHALAKLSELGSIGFHLIDARGERVVGRVVASDLDSDLALVEVEDVVLEPLAFTDEPIDWRVGQWIGAAGPGGTCIAVGSVSVGPRDIPLATHGLLGVYFAERFDGAGARIDRLVRDGSARAAGLEVGDVVVGVDGREYTRQSSIRNALRRTRPGQEVAIAFERDGERLERSVRMGGRQLDDYDADPWQRTQPHTADTISVSARRDGFESAVQHDAHLLPSECLSPAVDVRGRVVGLHIARMDRPGSLAMPVDTVLAALERLRERAGRAAGAADQGATAADGATRDV